MELNTPRHDPYSKKEVVRKELLDQGYKREFTVVDEENCHDEKGQRYHSRDLSINAIHRFIDKDVKDNSEVIHALSARSGEKGLLISHYGERQDEVVQNFLINVDKSDVTKNNY